MNKHAIVLENTTKILQILIEGSLMDIEKAVCCRKYCGTCEL